MLRYYLIDTIPKYENSGWIRKNISFLNYSHMLILLLKLQIFNTTVTTKPKLIIKNFDSEKVKRNHIKTTKFIIEKILEEINIMFYFVALIMITGIVSGK